MKQMIGLTLVVLGIMAMAGSAGDCDGKCMEQANDISTMLMVAGAGLIAVVFGGSLARG
jgi:hypothetical protein|tara:strand:- start:269 stop:445 length:177 start_codon:yes stop_codon:yes gene_type:complete